MLKNLNKNNLNRIQKPGVRYTPPLRGVDSVELLLQYFGNNDE